MKKQAILQAYKTADYQTKEMLKKSFPKYFALPEKCDEACEFICTKGGKQYPECDTNSTTFEIDGKTYLVTLIDKNDLPV